MRLLVIGGTRFFGRHLAEAAVARGYETSLFNRGRSGPEVAGTQALRGDRNSDLSALDGGEWDLVVDTSGYFPRHVKAVVDKLRSHAKHYTFISSISVYADPTKPGATEDSAVGTIEDDTTEEVTGETYGPLKALCEQVVTERFEGTSLVIRPGLIVGPWDPTDRFTYWPRRIAEGGRVLAPGRPQRQVQFIDARDLAEWTLDLATAGTDGVFHVAGPKEPLTMGDLLERGRAALGSDAEFEWVDEDFLLGHEVGPWMELPLWLPEDMNGMMAADLSRAFSAGLKIRPLEETVRDTYEWDGSRPPQDGPKPGLSREREAGLLTAWDATRAGASR